MSNERYIDELDICRDGWEWMTGKRHLDVVNGIRSTFKPIDYSRYIDKRKNWLQRTLSRPVIAWNLRVRDGYLPPIDVAGNPIEIEAPNDKELNLLVWLKEILTRGKVLKNSSLQSIIAPNEQGFSTFNIRLGNRPNSPVMQLMAKNNGQKDIMKLPAGEKTPAEKQAFAKLVVERASMGIKSKPINLSRVRDPDIIAYVKHFSKLANEKGSNIRIKERNGQFYTPRSRTTIDNRQKPIYQNLAHAAYA